MNNKGIVKIIMPFILIVIGVIMIGGVVLPTIVSPEQGVSTTVANATEINITDTNSTNLTLSNPDTGYASDATLAIAHSAVTAEIYVYVEGNPLGTIDGTNTTTFTNVSQSWLTTDTEISFADDEGNVTSATLTYTDKGEFYDWSNSTQSLWLILGMLVIAAFIIKIVP